MTIPYAQQRLHRKHILYLHVTCALFPVPPRDTEITNIQEPIVERESTVVECVIARTFPTDDVSIKLIYQSGSSDDGDVKIEDTGDGKTHKLIYTDTVVFRKDDHNKNLSCCAEWRGNPTYACNSQVITVQCEFSINKHVSPVAGTLVFILSTTDMGLHCFLKLLFIFP